MSASTVKTNANPHPMEGRHVIVRASAAGAHAGTLASADGETVILTEARRLWYWKAAAGEHSLSGVARKGLAAGSKIPGPVGEIQISGVCEIIPTTAEAAASIAEFEVHNV
jgi:hypothetical protein